MKAMILAAGLGTRLRPLTNTIPKPLLPVGGTSLIVWNVLLLKRHGFDQIVINLHHLGPLIEQALGDGSKFGVQIVYSHEPVILGTGGGIKQAEPHFSGEPVLILNADTLVEVDLGALWDFHRTRHAAATLVLREDVDAARWGLIEVGEHQQILRITGKGLPVSTPAIPRMFAGIHVLHPRLLQNVAKGVPSSIIDPYIAAIERGERVLGYDLHGYWSDIGTAERYAQAEKDTQAGLIRLAERQ
ncbi:MAG: NDP-sugar synthase [Nitrospira sp.]